MNGMMDLVLKTLYETSNTKETPKKKKEERPAEAKEEEQKEEKSEEAPQKKLGYPNYNEALREMRNCVFNTIQFCRLHEECEHYVSTLKRLFSLIDKYAGSEKPNLNQLGQAVQSAIVKVRDYFNKGSEEYETVNREVAKLDKYT